MDAEQPVIFEGEVIPKCPKCKALIIWEKPKGDCVHCGVSLAGVLGTQPLDGPREHPHQMSRADAVSGP